MPVCTCFERETTNANGQVRRVFIRDPACPDHSRCTCSMMSGPDFDCPLHGANMPEVNVIARTCEVCGPGCGWCSHMRDLMASREDGDQLDFGIRFRLPLLSNPLIEVEVMIETEVVAGVASGLFLLVQDLVVPTDETAYELGMWNKGEGMASIRSVVLDWVKARAGVTAALKQKGKCESKNHSFKHNKAMLNVSEPPDIFQHNLALATQGMCLAEYNELAALSGLVPNAGGS